MTLDPSPTPAGHHVVHAYMAASEPYSIWERLDRHSEEYKTLKREHSEVIWQALEVIIPDLRERAKIALLGTRLTHERFLRRHRGTRGAGYRADRGQAFPGPTRPPAGHLCWGDSNVPGVGVPAVLVSGMIAADTLVSVEEHLGLLDELS